jgi:thymidylate kinase
MPDRSGSEAGPPRRGLVVAVEGLSGAGKTRLLTEWAARTGAPLLLEAWQRLRPRPSLAYSDRSDLLQLELRLLREDLRRYEEARRGAEEHPLVLCDTDFLGTLNYVVGLGRLDPTVDALQQPIARKLSRELHAGRWGLADRYLYLDVPPALAMRRSARNARAHPERWRARHLAVGLYERSFWLEEFPPLAPDRLMVLDGRERVPRLIASAQRATRSRRPPQDSGSGERVLRALLRGTAPLPKTR